MPVSLEHFSQSLAASGLMSADQLQAFLAELPPDRRPQDAQALARELIRAEKLTRYQAAAIYQGKTKGHAVCSHCGGEADIWIDI